MPRPRRNPLFELAGQWIAREPNRAGLWRYWYDARTQRVRRAPLGLENLEQAKLKLAAIVLSADKPDEASPLAGVMLRYHEEHTDAQRSGKMARTATRKVLGFFGATASVCDLEPERMQDFARDLIAKGAALAYIARIVGVIAAGLAFSRIRGIEIPTGLAWLEKLEPNAKAPRRVAIPADAQFAWLLSQPCPEPLFRWMLLSLATGARPEAIADLRPEQRRDGLLDMNPPGRRQNKKHRPVVREPAFLTPWLDSWQAGLSGAYVGYSSVSSVQTALQRVTGGAFPVSVYSFRHKVATVLRRAKRNGVTEDDIAAQLGHKRPNLRVTGAYGEYASDYLDAPCAALDRWLRGLEFSRSSTANRDIQDCNEIKYKAASKG